MINEVITDIVVCEMFSLVFANYLLDELLRFSNLKFREHCIFNVSILRVKVLNSTLLHLGKTNWDVNATLLHLAFD